MRETRVAGYDPKSVYVEQRFVVDGEVFAVAHQRARFLRRAGGVVPIDELTAALGVDPAERPLAPWLAEWAERVALPGSRESMPSVWE